MILLILRNPTSYFRPYRNHFVAIYAAFIPFPVRELLLLYGVDNSLLRASTQSMVAAALVIAVYWGHLATQLYLYPEVFSLRSLLAGLNRSINQVFILYLVPMAVTLTASISVPGIIDVDPARTAAYVLSGVTYRAVGYTNEFLGLASSVIVAFVGYPFLMLVRLRSQLKDPEVRSALRVIATCFGIISGLLLAINALDSFGLSVVAPGHLVSIGLLIVVVRAFSKPSFLKAFLGVVPSLQALPGGRRSGQTVLIYADDDEKLGPISKFVNEGVGQQARVIYFYRGEESALREGLSGKGVNVRQWITKGSLRLVPLESLYQGEGAMDAEAAMEYCGELLSEARALGKQGLRLIVDYGDHARRPSQKFVEHLSDPRWTTSDHFLTVLMAFQKSAFQGQENALDLLRTKIPVLELSDSVDSFSRTVGLSHSEIMGNKILLEFDPVSDYDKVLRSLLAESVSNFERAIVFTRRDSPVQSILAGQLGAKVFILTSTVSYPKIQTENLVLLPAHDTSLLLDALNKTIEAFTGSSFTIIFDNISHYIFTIGPDRTQSLVRQSLELIVSDKITAVFLINLGAHDQKTISTFENFFDVELVCRPGARLPEVRKMLSVKAG